MNDEKKINTLRPLQGAGRKLFVETYGCQMNVGDTEIVVAIMQQEGYVYTDKIEEADVVLINTCSIRDNAEQRIWGRLREMAHLRRRRPGVLVGIIGCMAERLRERLLEGENPVDIVAGPDAYRDLPRLVREAGEGGRGVNVLLSREETYAEIAPVRLDRNGVSGYIAIMRGCNNYCSYCVVPYTRGVERSRVEYAVLESDAERWGIGELQKELDELLQDIRPLVERLPAGVLRAVATQRILEGIPCGIISRRMHFSRCYVYRLLDQACERLCQMEEARLGLKKSGE